MAILLLSVISLYAVALAALYLHNAHIGVGEERYFRYAGILFFLLVLTALDQRRVPLAKGLICVTIFVLGCYGLQQYITAAYAQMQRGYYDPMTGISQVVSPTILQYLRSDARQHHIQRPVAVIPSPPVAISLPQFRTILN
jgi:DNA topoisomerase IB